MTRFLVRRLLQSFVVVIGMSVVAFLLIRLSGDPVVQLLGSDATPEQIVALRHSLGLDRPLFAQYAIFLSNALRGDFGYSFRNAQPAMSLVLSRAPATLALASSSFVVALLLAVPTGILAATHRDGPLDVASRALALLGQAVAPFWLGIMLILTFSVHLGWFPPFGGGDVFHLVLPSLALGAFSAGVTSRLLRSSLLEVLNSGYVQVARGKGLPERAIVLRHALRNAAIPVVTVLGLQVASLLGGSIIIEHVFSYPGLGSLVLDAIGHRDYAVVQAFVVFIAIFIAVINLLVDLLYVALDPRIKYE